VTHARRRREKTSPLIFSGKKPLAKLELDVGEGVGGLARAPEGEGGGGKGEGGGGAGQKLLPSLYSAWIFPGLQ